MSTKTILGWVFVAAAAVPALGVVARDELRSDHPAPAVLLDLSLPLKSGEEVLQFLRTRFPNTRVIILTGGAWSAEELDGIADVIRKPVKLAELVGRVRLVLDS